MGWGRSSSNVSKNNILEEPWEYKAKHPDHYVVYGRKEEAETYKYPQPGHSRYCWMPIPDDMHKVFIITDKDKYEKNPNDKRYAHWQYFDFPRPLILTQDPGPWCLPQEALTYKPTDDVVFKYFFKGTKKEVKIRQIFFHTALTEQEEEWVAGLRDYCRWKKFPWRGMADPYLLRIAYFGWRKQKENYAPFAYQHLLDTYTWRAQMFPLTDADPEILEDLAKGMMYWTARDKELRPLLIVRIQKEERKPTAQRFLKLTIFCFEWAVRYLFVPGKIETCTVLFDIQNVGLSDIPLSAIGEMVNALTHEYPFRLDKMWIVHDSVWISTGWACAKQFLTEVQQEKIKFYRKKEILPVVAPFFSKHQLEERYGGCRPPITKFYPFPLLPGPFDPDSEGANPNAIPNCHEVFTEESSIGKLWVDGCRDPLLWSDKADEVFKHCGLRGPNAPIEEPEPSQVEESDEPKSPVGRTPTIQITPPSSRIQTPTTAPPISKDVLGDTEVPSAARQHPAEDESGTVAKAAGIEEEEVPVGDDLRLPESEPLERKTDEALLIAQWSSNSFLSSIESSSSLSVESRFDANGKGELSSDLVSPTTAATLQPSSEEAEGEEGFTDKFTAPLSPIKINEKEDKGSKATTKEPTEQSSEQESEKGLTDDLPGSPIRTPEKRPEAALIKTAEEVPKQLPEQGESPAPILDVRESAKNVESQEQLPREQANAKESKSKKSKKKSRGSGGVWRFCCPGKKVMESEVRDLSR